MDSNFTSRIIRSGAIALALIVFLAQSVLAQRAPVVGDFKTVTSGNWDAVSIWQVYMGSGASKDGWVKAADMPAGQQLPTSTSDVFVTRGFAVTLTQDGICNNLYLSTVDAGGVPKATVAVGANTLAVNGKLSGYTGVPGNLSTTGTIAGSTQIAGLSTDATGKIKFTGLSRTIINAGEWNESANNYNVEIALTNNETATLGRDFGVQNLNVVSGVFDPNNKRFYAEGNVAIATGGTLSSLATGTSPVISNRAGLNGGTVTVNGTLILKGANPTFTMAAVDFSAGTVVYNGGTAPQTLIVSHNGVAVAYNNLSLSTNQEKLVPAGAAITVNGVLSIDAGSKMVLNGGQLNLNSSVAGAGTIASDAAAVIAVGGNGNAGTINFTSGNQIAKQFTINRSSNGSITLGTPLTVTELLNVANGVITTFSNKMLTVADNATVTGGNTSSYVEGPLARNMSVAGVATQLFFPVGKGGAYRPVTLTMTHSSAGVNTYIAEQFNSAPATRELPVTIQSVSPVRYFAINKSGTAAISNGVVALHYGSDEGITDAAGVRIVKSGSVSEPWADLGRSALSSGELTGTVISSQNFTTFSDFAIAKAGAGPLPVELISFDAKANGAKVNLSWATATEKNNDHFVVERSHSAKGEAFKAIATVKGKGNSDKVNLYAATDDRPVNGTAYYRLKQVDTDGTVAYSKLVAVHFSGPSVGLAVYPNPAIGTLALALTAATENATVTITNSLGQVVLNQAVNNVSGNEIVVDVAALPAGAYQVQVAGPQGVVASRFIKAVN